MVKSPKVNGQEQLGENKIQVEARMQSPQTWRECARRTFGAAPSEDNFLGNIRYQHAGSLSQILMFSLRCKNRIFFKSMYGVFCLNTTLKTFLVWGQHGHDLIVEWEEEWDGKTRWKRWSGWGSFVSTLSVGLVDVPLNLNPTYPACALKALGLLVADGALVVGGGKTFGAYK